MSAIPSAFSAYADEPLQQAPASSLGKNGRFEATLARSPAGRTRLLRELVEVPYHLSGTLETDPVDGLTTLCVQDPTGGVVQGDRHHMDVTLRDHARARITTQSATKVHRMQANYAHLDAEFVVGSDAYLEYLPRPLILNESARCLQTTKVHVAEGGIILASDIIGPHGLSAHEPFSFDHYHGRFSAVVDETTICEDAIDIAPARESKSLYAVVGDEHCLGTVYLVAPSEPIEPLIEAIHDRIEALDHIRAGVSRLPEETGLTVRILASRVADVEATVREVWGALRRAILGTGIPAGREV